MTDQNKTTCTCTSARERKSCRRRDYCEDEAAQVQRQCAADNRRQTAREIVEALSYADDDTLDVLRELLERKGNG